MRKPIVPRFLLLLVLYAVIIIILVQLQFAKNTNFTFRVGDLIIQGNHGTKPSQILNSYSLSGDTSVFFGGVEFILGNGLLLTGSVNTPCRPELMTLTDNEVYFRLDEGSMLVFTTQYTGGAIELVVRADFFGLTDSGQTDSEQTEVSEESSPLYHSLKIPFRLLPTSTVVKKGQTFLINADGVNYTFNRNTDTDNIVLENQNLTISYRVLLDKEVANPREFIIPAAQDSEQYEATLALWLDQSYLLWNRTVAGSGESVDGELISAYMSEALKRGTYRAAVTAVSTSWNPANVFYEASAYIGRLDTALKTFSAAEWEKTARLARLFNEKSADFLEEFHTIEFLAVRGYDNLIDDAAKILRTFDPATMTAEQAAGFLEGYLDWDRYRSGRYNPFDRFVDQALFVITGGLQKNNWTGDALVFTKIGAVEEADTELNLRLGSSLIRFDDEARIGLGRTLILSVLSLANNAGSVPRRVQKNFSGSGDRLESQEIYRICFAGENYARTQAVSAGLWAWTAASSISGSPGIGRLDITVDFSANETHYMMIRGIKPFSSLQISGSTYNQDSQFERYDYSGWTYSAPEQTLLLKIRHRAPTERVTIIY